MSIYVALIIVLVAAIIYLDVEDNRMRAARASEGIAVDDDDLVLDDIDLRELAAIERCMIEGRNVDARDRLERWLDDTFPEWRRMR